MKIRALFTSGCAMAALATGFASPAAAQTESEAQSGTSGNMIIVTARRRDETAQETPVPMTVLGGDLIDRYGIDGVADIQHLTPGLYTGETSGAMGGSISLRGVGSGESMAFIDQAVSINVDGVPVSSAQIMRAAQMDLRQIEVLRGPQTLFFGKNSPGGIISILTADPDDFMEVEIGAGYEVDAEEFYGDFVISGPLSEQVGVRVAAHYSNMQGYIDVVTPNEPGQTTPPPGVIPSDLGSFPNQEELFLRATFAFDISDSVRMTTKATLTDTDITGGSSFFSDIVACPYGVPQRPFEDASNCQNDGVIFTSQFSNDFLALNPLLEGPYGFRTNKQGLISNTLEVDLSDSLTLTSVTGFYTIDEDLTSNGGYGPTSNNGFAVLFDQDQFSQELRLASEFDGPFNFLIGGFYENRKLFTKTVIAIPGFGLVLPIESTNQTQDSYSAFGQLLFDVTDQIQITAGGRYTHEVKKLDDFIVETGGVATDVTQLAGYPSTRQTYNDFSPEVTLSYQPNDDLLLFASYKQGFKSGGFDAGFTNGAILGDPGRGQAFGPEEVDGFEVGLKSQLADRQLTINLTGYWYDYEGLQVSVFDNVARAFKLQNAAKARVRGVELDVQYEPNGIEGLSLRGSVAYNDAKYRDYLADCYAGQTVALGCAFNFSPNADPTSNTQGSSQVNGQFGYFTAQDLSGQRLRKAPEWTASIGAYYETPINDSWMVSLSSDLAYSSDYNVGTQLQPLAVQDDFAKIDATFRLFSQDKQWEFAVIGRNLTDKRNLVNGLDRTGTGGVSGVRAATKGNNLPSCTMAGEANCSALADIIGTPTRGRSVAFQLTWRYR